MKNPAPSHAKSETVRPTAAIPPPTGERPGLRHRLGRRGVSFLRRQWRPLLLIGFIFLVLVLFQAVLTPFIVAFALAYVLYPPVQRLARFQIRGAHLPVWVSILIVYVVLIGGSLTALALAGPPVLAQLQKLIDTVPGYAETVNLKTDILITRLENVLATWERAADETDKEKPAESDPQTDASAELEVTSTQIDATPTQPAQDGTSRSPVSSSTVGAAIRGKLAEYRTEALDSLGRLGAELPVFVEGLIRSIFNFFLMLMLTFMFLMSFPKIFSFAQSLVPVDYQDEFENIVREVHLRLAGVVRGQLLICLINGVLTYVGFRVIGVPFASLLAVVAGILSLIPIFGSIISTIPAALIGLTQSATMGLSVVGWVIVIHMLEAYILNPLIMGDSAHMSPLLIVFALLVGSHYFHPVLGPLLAAPIAAIIQTVFLHFLARPDREEEEAEAAEPRPAEG